MTPLVSIIIPTYNRANLVGAAVESVLGQTFPDFELIVVDDGSTDTTRQLLEPYHDRINYIYQENQKYSSARNRGIRAATGKYVAFLDDDDLWQPEKLAEQISVMEQNPGATLCYCKAVYIDPAGKPIQFQGRSYREPDEPTTVIADRYKELFLGALLTTSSVMVRHDILNQVGLFEGTHIHGEDWELWVRLASKGPFAYVPKPLVLYRFYGWQKILKVETMEAWLLDQFKTIDTATRLWEGDPAEGEKLRAQGIATIYLRAALSSLQTGQGEQGKRLLGKAIETDPSLLNRERLVHLAVDRAKLIEIEYGSQQQALAYLSTFYANLPSHALKLYTSIREAVAWIYLGDAFDLHRCGDQAAVRRQIFQAIRHFPACLKNRGVLSITLEALLGRSLATHLRRSPKSCNDLKSSHPAKRNV
jgi:glycosyltransferase involved in cell wall biosynthesis